MSRASVFTVVAKLVDWTGDFAQSDDGAVPVPAPVQHLRGEARRDNAETIPSASVFGSGGGARGCQEGRTSEPVELWRSSSSERASP